MGVRRQSCHPGPTPGGGRGGAGLRGVAVEHTSAFAGGNYTKTEVHSEPNNKANGGSTSLLHDARPPLA